MIFNHILPGTNGDRSPPRYHFFVILKISLKLRDSCNLEKNLVKDWFPEIFRKFLENRFLGVKFFDSLRARHLSIAWLSIRYVCDIYLRRVKL